MHQTRTGSVVEMDDQRSVPRRAVTQPLVRDASDIRLHFRCRRHNICELYRR